MLWWWAGLASAAVTVLVVLVAWWWRRPTAARADVVVAHMDRIRALPRHRFLIRRLGRSLLAQLLGWLLVAFGAGLSVARLVAVDDEAEEMRTRDIMLCLDVSGSMTAIDRDVIASYRSLVGQLDQERIGLVAFDSAAISVFPLTRDRDHIEQRLAELDEALQMGHALPGVMAPDAGSSLIGDGLAACLTHFDELDVVRSRTVVFATDNMLSGEPIYTLDQATDLAVEHQIMVFGILPGEQDTKEAVELHEQVRRTDGDTLALVPGRASNVELITRAVQAQTRSALLALPSHRSFDLVWPGAALMLLGMAVAILARRGERG